MKLIKSLDPWERVMVAVAIGMVICIAIHCLQMRHP